MGLPANIRLEDGWVAITNTDQKRHQKEPAETWFDRLLGLPETGFRAFRLGPGRVVEVRPALGEIEERELPETRIEVLRSFERQVKGAKNGPDRRRGDGGAVILCDEERSLFLLTRKDHLHPNPRCRGRLALVSGSLEEGEDFREGALRELYEEVRDLALADAAASLLRPLGTRTMPAVQWPNDYRLGAFLAACPAALFASWRAAWGSEEVLSEASPWCIGREELLAAIHEEEASPGSRFVASQHEALRLALAADLG